MINVGGFAFEQTELNLFPPKFPMRETYWGLNHERLKELDMFDTALDYYEKQLKGKLAYFYCEEIELYVFIKNNELVCSKYGKEFKYENRM